MSLKNHTILVPGGSRGIGRAIVLDLARRGANVAFTYQKEDTCAHETEKLARDLSGYITAYRVDSGNGEDIKRFVHSIAARHGTIDGLVNSAGIRMDRTLLYMDDAEWDRVIDIDLTGVYRMTKAVIPYMLKAKKGRIVNISSVSGISGLSGQTNYSAAKAGLHGFTKALAKETASFGIAVNAVAPGPVETEMLKGLSEEYLERLLSNVPVKRLCAPEEVALVVRFLLDDQMSPGYLTGQILSLDGGMGL